MNFNEDQEVSLFLKDLEILDEIENEFGNLKILYHESLGKVLIINNEIQHVESWVPLYHEPLVHLPASFLSILETVLVLGGGSFFAAQEILKYESVKKVIMVDHDSDIIKLMSNNYKHVQEVLADERFSLVIDDLYSYIERTTDKFDLVINDAVNLIKDRDFTNFNMYEKLADLNTLHGICADLIYRHIFDKELNSETLNYLKRSFDIAISLVIVPEYPGCLHLLTMWSKNIKLTNECNEVKNIEQKTRFANSEVTSYYDPNYISYYLYLPVYIKNKLVTK